MLGLYRGGPCCGELWLWAVCGGTNDSPNSATRKIPFSTSNRIGGIAASTSHCLIEGGAVAISGGSSTILSRENTTRLFAETDVRLMFEPQMTSLCNVDVNVMCMERRTQELGEPNSNRKCRTLSMPTFIVTNQFLQRGTSAPFCMKRHSPPLLSCASSNRTSTPTPRVRFRSQQIPQQSAIVLAPRRPPP